MSDECSSGVMRPRLYLVCVICVQLIADAQQKLKDPSISEGRREELGRDLLSYGSYLQTGQEAIEIIDEELEVQKSALKGGLCHRP